MLSASLSPAQRDIVLVLVNDPEYGGSGGAVAVASTNSAVVELVLHELGHSFGLLADEYGGPPPPQCNASFEPSEVNVTKQNQRDLIKWNLWIDGGTPVPTLTTTSGVPGLYEGAKYCDTGLYRPTYDSKMRFLNRPFDQINEEQLVKRTYNWVSPIDSSDPTETDLSLASGQMQSFSVSTPAPLSAGLNVTWSLDGQTVGTGQNYTLDTTGLASGLHTVAVLVEDPTPMVRNDPAQILTDTRSWNVTIIPNTPPTSDSVSPSSGSGTSQTFTYLFSDLDGYEDMTSIQILVNETLSASGSCYLYYVLAANELYLRNDASSDWLGPQTVGAAGMLQNTKCSVDLGTSSVLGSGTSLALDLAMTFNTSGDKNQWMLAIDTAGQHLGWVLNGTWNVPPNQPPTSDSVSPSSGSGASQTFSYVFSDSNGYEDMTSIQILVNETLSASGSCYLYYVLTANELYLRNDASSDWLGPQTVGAAGMLQNTKCSVDLGTSSVLGSGTSLALDLAMTFNTSGDKNQWMLAIDTAGQHLGWVLNGTWNVPPNQPPTSDSVSPSSGSGASQTFSYVFSDSNGYEDMTSIQILVNETLSASGSCYLYYVLTANELYLRNDASSDWLGPQTVGAAGMLQNTKCSVDLGTSSVLGSGTSLTLDLAMTFNTSGDKNQWMLAIDTAGQHLGWVLNGTWNVPGGPNQPPTSDSVSPSSGSGASQTFSYVFRTPTATRT